jgi:two-component system OmpR family response regulator
MSHGTAAEVAGAERPHILVVDDNVEIRSLLGRYLEKHSMRSTVVSDGAAMRRAMERSHFDLIVLDVMMPGEDGFSLCRSLRAWSQVPIIMLTARADEVDRILGLEFGADDYLVKPFNPRELLGRINAVLRRSQQRGGAPGAEGANGYRFGGWMLDTRSRIMLDPQGQQAALTGAEFRLLVVLLAHPERVLSRVQIMTLAHGREHHPNDRSLDMRVSRLRQLFGEDARAPRIVKTVHGEGYFIGVPVERF